MCLMMRVLFSAGSPENVKGPAAGFLEGPGVMPSVAACAETWARSALASLWAACRRLLSSSFSTLSVASSWSTEELKPRILVRLRSLAETTQGTPAAWQALHYNHGTTRR